MDRADVTLCTAKRATFDCAEIDCALVKDDATLTAVDHGDAACCDRAAVSSDTADNDWRDQRFGVAPRFSGAGWEKEMSEQMSEPDGELCGGGTVKVADSRMSLQGSRVELQMPGGATTVKQLGGELCSVDSGKVRGQVVGASGEKDHSSNSGEVKRCEERSEKGDNCSISSNQLSGGSGIGIVVDRLSSGEDSDGSAVVTPVSATAIRAAARAQEKSEQQ